MITCSELSGWLLEADLYEVTRPTNTNVASHLASCVSCSARLARILGDSARLASAVGVDATPSQPYTSAAARGARNPNRKTHRAMIVTAAGALMAASVVVLVLARGRGEPVGSKRIAPGDAVPVARLTIPEVVSATVNPPDRQTDTASETRRVSKPRIQARAKLTAFQQRLAAAPPPSPPSLPAEHNGADDAAIGRDGVVDVQPHDLKQVAVLRSTDPRVTVVWFY